MSELFEVSLNEHQVSVLDDIRRLMLKTMNTACHDAIRFAHTNVVGLGAGRLVLRNVDCKLQRDLYVGKGITLSYFDRTLRDGKGGSSPALSFWIEGDAEGALVELKAAGFGEYPPAAISRALWLYREVTTTIFEEDDWMFGCLHPDGRFEQVAVARTEPVASRTLESVRRAVTVAISKNRPLTEADWIAIRNYLESPEIESDDKLSWVNELLSLDASLLEKIRHWAMALALNSDEAQDIGESTTGVFETIPQLVLPNFRGGAPL